MFDLKTSISKTDRRLLSAPLSQNSQEPKQRRMMVIALSLLLVALGFVLYRDRDFWFPDAQEAQESEEQSLPGKAAGTPPQSAPIAAKASSPAAESKSKIAKSAKSQPKEPAAAPAAPPITATTTTTRTVLPPLEVEVVAGDVHRTVHPGSNSVRVDLQPGTPARAGSDPANSGTESAADVTHNAAERVQMSTDTSDIVSRSVKPGYPLLARQMKVQGSVILQALISRDGAIQDLHVVSGPPILASAAQEAVRQWHFKPHYLGSETVETQAKITVNFTISTN